MGDRADEMKGRAKEALGDLTGDDELRREGELDQGVAGVKRKAGEVADRVREKIEDVLHRDR